MSGNDFRYYLRVRYSECDAQKVVFNARYGDYLELATTEFMRALGYGAALADGSLDYQLVKQTMEWKAPARYDQVIEARVRSTGQGNTSFSIRIEFRLAGEDAIISTGETVYVLVDSHSLAKRPLPEEFRAALLRGAPGDVADHAGHLAAR